MTKATKSTTTKIEAYNQAKAQHQASKPTGLFGGLVGTFTSLFQATHNLARVTEQVTDIALIRTSTWHEEEQRKLFLSKLESESKITFDL